MNARRRWLLATVVASMPAALRAQAPPLSSEFHANTYTTLQQTEVGVASAGNGSFVLAWVSEGQDGSGRGIFAQRFSSLGPKAGGEFQVNTYTAGDQTEFSIAADASGNFIVVWRSDQDGSDYGIFGQRFNSSGAKVGPEFQVNTYTTGAQREPAVAMDAAGSFLVSWSSYQQDGSATGVFAQRFNSSGSKAGAEFQVNTHTTSSQAGPALAATRSGDFVVVWTSYSQDGSDEGLFGQRIAANGTRVGSEFAVNAFTTGYQILPRIAVDPSDGFVVVWDGGGPGDADRGVFGQRFNRSAERIGPEFTINSYTGGGQFGPSVATDRNGGFVVVWNSDGQDGSGLGIFGQRFLRGGNRVGSEFQVNAYTTSLQFFSDVAETGLGPVVVWSSRGQVGISDDIFGRRQTFEPVGIVVDGHGIGTSDLNGVLEPGEAVVVDTEWANNTDFTDIIDGNAPGFSGPAGPTYSLLDSSASYGTMPPFSAATCNDGTPGACYAVQLFGTRPAAHWDSTLHENLSGGAQFWTLHVGDSFADVPRLQPFYRRIETLLHHGITSGCNATQYCPGLAVRRDQMAIFVAKGIAGSGELVPSAGTVGAGAYNCTAGGHSLFSDVLPTDDFCRHVHYLAAQNVTLGCSATQYCPTQTITRDAMASFIAKAIVAPQGTAGVPATYSQAGRSYSCIVGSPNLHFTDVPAAYAFCKHIHYLWARGIVDGCSATQYCPGAPVARDAMAKFIANGFRLELYRP